MTEGIAPVDATSRSAQDILLFDPISPAWARDLKSAVFSSSNARRTFISAIEALTRQEGVNESEEAKYRRAVGLLIIGEVEESRRIIEGLPGEQPYKRFFIGRALVALKQNEAAQKTLEEALELNPTDHDVRVAYLDLISSLKDPERLAHEIEMGRHIEGTPDWYYFLGCLAELKRDYQTAIDEWERALDLDPNHPKALFFLARELDRFGEDERAILLYEQAAALRPVYMEALMNLGILYEDQDKYMEALHCFSTVLKEDSTNWKARLYYNDAMASMDMYYDEDQEKKEDRRNQILRIPISDFELSVRSRNCLAKMEIKSLGDLVKKTETELLSYKNFGDTSLQEIKEILRQKNLKLGLGREELPNVLDTYESPDTNSPPEANDPRARPIGDLDLSVRARRVVEMLKTQNLGELCNKTEAEFLACPNFGQTSLNELKQKLDKFGLSLKG